MTLDTNSDSVADAVKGGWVDRFAPPAVKPYMRLARLDRPIGTWLLLLPCLWSTALAASASGVALPNIRHMALFAIGAALMRGAGCTFNDLVDRNFDARVARTALRPIPSGQVTPRQAVVFMTGLCLAGLVVLLQFNTTTILLGIASLAVIAVYPFMKRITHWPQLVLGLAFNWGVLLGWTASIGRLNLPAVVLYVSAIAWTIGYDTIYAHQDKDDDAIIGLKSTALLFGDRTVRYLAFFYTVAWTGIFVAGWLSGGGVVFATAMAVAAGHLAWQATTLRTDDADNCLQRFRSNRDFGLIVLAGLVLDAALRG